MDEGRLTVPVIEVSFPDDEIPERLITRSFTVMKGIAFYRSSGSNSNSSHAWFPMLGMITDYNYIKCPYLNSDQKRGLECAAGYDSGWIIKVGSFFEKNELKNYIKRTVNLSSIKPLRDAKKDLINLMHKINNESSEARLSESEIDDLACRCGSINLAAISACCALNMPEDKSFWTQTPFGKKMTQVLQEIAPEYFQTKISCNIVHQLNDAVCSFEQAPVIINEFISTLNGYLFDGRVSNYIEAIDKYPSLQETGNVDSLSRFLEKLPENSPAQVETDIPAPSSVTKIALKEIKGQGKDEDNQKSSKPGCSIM